MGIQLEALTSTRGAAPSSSEPGQGAWACRVQPGCDPEQGQWWGVSGTAGLNHGLLLRCLMCAVMG